MFSQLRLVSFILSFLIIRIDLIYNKLDITSASIPSIVVVGVVHLDAVIIVAMVAAVGVGVVCRGVTVAANTRCITLNPSSACRSTIHQMIVPYVKSS